MLNFYQSLVVNIIKVLQLPRYVKGDMDGPCANGQCWRAVAFQRVANHQQFRRVNALMLAQGEELALGLVGGDFHIVEIF